MTTANTVAQVIYELAKRTRDGWLRWEGPRFKPDDYVVAVHRMRIGEIELELIADQHGEITLRCGDYLFARRLGSSAIDTAENVALCELCAACNEQRVEQFEQERRDIVGRLMSALGIKEGDDA